MHGRLSARGLTAANAPVSAVAVQPRPVTRVIMGWPLAPMTEPLETIKSAAPLTLTTA